MSAQSMAEIRHHICNLLYCYAEAVDDGDMDTLKALFRHAKLHAGSRTFEGEEGIVKMFEDVIAFYDDRENKIGHKQGGIPRTAHIVTNPIIEPMDDEPDKVTSRSRFTVFQQLSNFPLQSIVAGSYHDIFERMDGTWRFAEREYLTVLVGDISSHCPDDSELQEAFLE